ncbi:putative serine 3-dehydrogenase [Diaporthe ampelina]|uniref:Putative serine 3-dehydrogenase n=1 Tax=Diaporthe ampelina TaxID=1214573 RepID=A0A0G2FW26_9PEZI|nr:putative serine 3-dehydrogenase [Diaporthe ampelina]
MADNKVWLITGCASGLGREIALAALERRDIVVATARDPSKLSDLAARGAIIERVDVTDSDQDLAAAVKTITSKTPGGRVDVLVNNAGYILAGGVEEASREEAQAIFDTNVFGQLNMIRAVLPVMRAARSGVVANLGSIGGWRGSPGAGLYCATKACASILAESLRAEVAHLGIKVTSVEPGYTRTNLLVPGHRLRSSRAIGDLGGGAVGDTLASLDSYSLNQPGDPAKAARLVVDALTASGSCRGRELPPRLVVGRDAYGIVSAAIETHRGGMELWKDLTTATDCDA